MRIVVALALVLVVVLGASRWLSGKSDESSQAVVTAITTPIEQAARIEAEANVRGAMSAVQLYFAENGTYAGISTAALRAIDAGLSPTVQIFPLAGSYCLMATSRGVSVRSVGPSPDVTDGSCLSG